MVVTFQAMQCYVKAAKLGHARSAYNLAILHLHSEYNSAVDGQRHKAIGLLQQAARLGLKEVF